MFCKSTWRTHFLLTALVASLVFSRGALAEAQQPRCLDPKHAHFKHNCATCLHKTFNNCTKCTELGFACICSCFERPARGLPEQTQAAPHGSPKHAIPVLSVSLTMDPMNYLPRMLMSIDYPIERILIKVGNADPVVLKNVMASMKHAQQRNARFLRNNVRVQIVKHNPGAANGMNLGLRYLLDLPDGNAWALIVNSDIEFKPKSLRKFASHMHRRIAEDPAAFGVGFMNLHPGATWSAFAPTQRLAQRVGLFDENFYPAYMEDVDYAYRLLLSGFKVAMFPDALVAHGPVDHGEKNYISGTTFTIRSIRHKHADTTNTERLGVASGLQNLVDRGIQSNLQYYAQKWGALPESPCLSVDKMTARTNCSMNWTLPFNKSDLSLRDWLVGSRRRTWIQTGDGRLEDAWAADDRAFSELDSKPPPAQQPGSSGAMALS